MSFAKTIKEIYESQKNDLASSLSYCEIAPEFDDGKWESKLNSLAENEEPHSVLCYGSANSKSLLSLLSKSDFMFTEEYVYIQGLSGGTKYADISKISYQKETKSGVFKQKIEEFLVVELREKKEELKGNFATEAIATFLNSVVQRFKANPVAPTPKKEYPNVKKIMEAFEENKCENITYQIAPNIPQKKLNKFIIHFAKEETKNSIAGLIESSKIPTLFFTNDFLYCKNSEDFKKIKYNDLSNAAYSETEKEDGDGNIIREKKVSLYNASKEVVFDAFDVERQFADLLSQIISKTTGKEIKTEVANEKSVFFTLLDKWDGIFQKKGFIINPEIKKADIPYISQELRKNRYESSGLTAELSDMQEKTITVHQYITSTSMLEIGWKEAEIKFVQLSESPTGMRTRHNTSKIPVYFIRYYADKNNKNAYLLFCFDAEDFDEKVDPCGFLRLEFNANGTGLCKEAIISPDDMSRTSKVSLALTGYASSTFYCDSNIGLEKLLSTKGRSNVYDHLRAFIEQPYTLTDEERKRLEKIEEEKRKQAEEEERKKAEEQKRQEAIEQAKRMEEEQKRQEEEERKKRELEEEIRKQQEAELAKEKSALSALNDF